MPPFRAPNSTGDHRAMSEITPTPRTTLKRLPERGHHDRETIYRILDEGIVCHLGFVKEGQYSRRPPHAAGAVRWQNIPAHAHT